MAAVTGASVDLEGMLACVSWLQAERLDYLRPGGLDRLAACGTPVATATDLRRSGV